MAAIAESGPTPCATAPETWVADKSAQQAIAAAACQACPVLTLCAEYADAAKERGSVWAGRPRQP